MFEYVILEVTNFFIIILREGCMELRVHPTVEKPFGLISLISLYREHEINTQYGDGAQL